MKWIRNLVHNFRGAVYATDPIAQIVLWNKSRNLNTYDERTEDNLLAEELEELSAARTAIDSHGIIDAYADILVVVTGSIHKYGYNPNLVLAETLKEITSRKGSINPETGKWEKDLNQDPNSLYKADYSNCKY